MNKVWKFFTEMDAKAARALWVSVGLFAAATLVLVIGSAYVEIDQGEITKHLHELRAAWWSPLAVTAVFTVLAFIGAPQIALIAATVAVFGSGLGIVLSWIATMISAAVGFYMGRFGGQRTLERLSGGFVQRMRDTVKGNGFLAALIIRLVPSGPFIMVNMALGATGVRASHYFGGSGLGIVPKIVLVAMAGHGMDELFTGDNLLALAFLAGAAAVWLLIVLVVRPMARARQAATTKPAAETQDSPLP